VKVASIFEAGGGRLVVIEIGREVVSPLPTTSSIPPPKKLYVGPGICSTYVEQLTCSHDAQPHIVLPKAGTASALADPLTTLSALANDPASAVTDFINVVNTLSSDASTAYGTLLATADLANVPLTSIPAYEVTISLDNLSNPIDAIGLPIAAETAAVTMAGGFELEILAEAASIIATSLVGLIP